MAWYTGKRWPRIALGVVAALVIVVGICEAIGWPFLVGPVQSALAKTLDRRVVFGSDADRGVRIGLLGSVRVTAASIEIGSPEWSGKPHMLLAQDARLKLGYADLFRAWRGGALHVKDLEAAVIDANLERRADGKASWQFGKKDKQEPETAEKPMQLPTFGRLKVGDGHVAYDDELLPAQIDSRFALDDGSGGASLLPKGAATEAAQVSADASAARAASAVASMPSAASGAQQRGIVVKAGGAAGPAASAPKVALAEGESGFVLKSTGTYKKRLPVRVDLRTAGILRFLDAENAEAQPLSLAASIGEAQLAFDGTTTDPLHLKALKGRFQVSGASLAAAGEPLGVTLPTTPPFRTRGTVAKEGEVYNAVFESADIGSSRLNGAFQFDRRPKVPLLSGRLGGSRLAIVDLAPSIGAAPQGSDAPTPTKAGDRVFPDKKFDLPSLRAMDANVLIDVGEVQATTKYLESIKPLKAHLVLADGVLTVGSLDGVLAAGRVQGFLQLDGRTDTARWTADLRALGLDLEQWLKLERKGGKPAYLSGRMDAMVKVKGTGRSAAEILGSLDGDARLRVRDGAVSHLVIEAGGLDIAQALGIMMKGDEPLPLQCNVADLDFKNGVVSPKVFVWNTRDSTVWIDGDVSLKQETMDVRAVVSPKDFSPLTLRTPIHVKGTLGSPKVSVEASKLVGKAGAAALLAAFVNPLLAIVPFIDTGDKAKAQERDAQCQELAKTLGKVAPAVAMPASARVPAAAASPAASSAAKATRRR